ncbi:hypothetical protein BLL37_04645 [Pseudomonas azotoformans]|uniref:Uncharacterized protein n=1 Tax=Pseudomonas azotoformans TaxID=47878 RepID=A0A1V2JVM3_PSEAZ|nr:hypothetical protein [Pseudomonas azotoformans]OIN52312.1 hypothetical protein BFL39_03230 [Pseudomonas azotoformans]ONH48661.1 hypothetical protein BLL37_04645 [Pseudomonas azotoformans]SDN62697.1 hypothetical protein SAMN04489799_2439 [Pseudomonas azotoformans]
MIDWLNENTGAVQGLASISVAVLTALLARFTYRYVNLTGAIAIAAKEQVELARAQAQVSSSLAELAQEQRALNQQRLDEVKDKEENNRQEGKRELERLAARLLSQLSGSSSEPELDYLKNSLPISEDVFDSIRKAAEQARDPNTGNLESTIASLEAIVALQKRIATSPQDSYVLSTSERESYKTNLRNARDGLKTFTSYRPNNERY